MKKKHFSGYLDFEWILGQFGESFGGPKSSIFVCFSRLNYSTNRHIEKLLRSAVQVILDNAKVWQNSTRKSAVRPSDRTAYSSSAENASIKETIAEALSACQQKFKEKEDIEKAIRLKKVVFATILQKVV